MKRWLGVVIGGCPSSLSSGGAGLVVSFVRGSSVSTTAIAATVVTTPRPALAGHPVTRGKRGAPVGRESRNDKVADSFPAVGSVLALCPLRLCSARGSSSSARGPLATSGHIATPSDAPSCNPEVEAPQLPPTPPPPDDPPANCNDNHTNTAAGPPTASPTPPSPPDTPPEAVGPSVIKTGSASLAAKSDDDDDGLLVVEPMRWEQAPVDVNKIVDEKGQYIVSRVKWHEGALAYATPPPPGPLAPRFGYNVVQVKKGITYWQWYRKNPHFSWRHLNIHFVFMGGLTYLMTFLIEEIRHVEYEMKAPGAMAGEGLGKGGPTGRTRKTTFSREEVDAITAKMQDSYMSGKETDYVGNRDYAMRKIARPKEFSIADVQNVRRRPSEAAAIASDGPAALMHSSSA